MIELRRVPSIPLAVLRREVPDSELSRVVPECCGRVWDALRAQPTRPGRNVAVYWDDRVRLEAGVEFDGPIPEGRQIEHSATPAGLVACATHLGPYGGLWSTHDAIHAWCAANGHQLAGPRWELYGHWQTEWNEDPARIHTDVFYEVAERTDG